MKALSIRQPWAWAIIHAGKDIENRTRILSRAMVGQRFLIHASKGLNREEYNRAAEAIWFNCLTHVPAQDRIERGGFIGSALLLRYVQDGVRPGAAACVTDPRGDPEVWGNWYQGPVGLVLRDVRPMDFIPCKGALGFWEAPAGLHA